MCFSIQIFQLVALRCTSNRQHAILNLISSPLYSGGSKYKIHTVVIFQEGQYNLRTQGWQMALYLHFVCSMLSRGIMQQTWHGAMLLSNDRENIIGTLHCCNTFQQSSPHLTEWEWQDPASVTKPLQDYHNTSATECKHGAHFSGDCSAVPPPAATAQCVVCSFPPDLLTSSHISVTWCGQWPMDHFFRRLLWLWCLRTSDAAY